ncbi:hypothetical protein F2Q70_00045267 [Brassica cretica]|uniref:Secreted protein n=1 Tax=Brassica cretica TaxID=69181 RepID=A0A8S9KF72_BRACR|nr:hypothetical protein F2Q70_00045267 [Brassica cretica]
MVRASSSLFFLARFWMALWMMCGFLEWRGREEGKASLSRKGLGFLDGGVDEGRLVLMGLAGDFVGGLSLKEG